MRRAARTDQNHAEIVAGLRKMGCSVVSLADGAYYHRAHGERVWRLIEVVDAIAWPRWEGSAMYRPLSEVGDVAGPLVRPK